MISRAIHLNWINLKSLYYRIRFDWIREVVVVFCSCIRLALFYYIIKDFLDDKVQIISTSLYKKLQLSVGLLLEVFTVTACIYLCRREFHSPTSSIQLAKKMGEKHQVQILYWLFRIPILHLIVQTPVILLINHSFFPTPLTDILLILATSNILCLLSFTIPISPKRSPEVNPFIAGRSKLTTLLKWRIQQITLPRSIFMIKFFNLFALLIPHIMLLLLNFPKPLSAITSFTVGLYTASILAIQLAEDVRYRWFEQSLGVSHDQYMTTVQRLGLSLGLGIAFVVMVLSIPFEYDYVFILKLGLIAATPCWLIPDILFQIDPSRFFIQILSVLLIGLFVATAIYASIVGVILFPLIRYYGMQSQANRYYRC